MNQARNYSSLGRDTHYLKTPENLTSQWWWLRWDRNSYASIFVCLASVYSVSKQRKTS